MTTAACLLIALILDKLFGEPNWLWSRLPHPATLMGRAVHWADITFNSGQHRILKGTITITSLCAVTGTIGWLIAAIPDFRILEILLTAILLAQTSLVEHVRNVATGLQTSLAEGRRHVSYIVGRDTTDMDESAIARGAIESGAENFSDGVIAPAFWFLLLGLPGIMIYKMVNTADSMIGYRTAKYEKFGKAAARLDDVMNWVPARLSGILIALTRTPQAFKTMWAEAHHHRSPNAGWPEAAMAATLGIALSGPRMYNGQATHDRYLNAEGRKTLTRDDILNSTKTLNRAWLIATLALAIYVIANIFTWHF